MILLSSVLAVNDAGSWISYCEIRGINDDKLNVKKTTHFLFLKELVCRKRKINLTILFPVKHLRWVWFVCLMALRFTSFLLLSYRMT